MTDFDDKAILSYLKNQPDFLMRYADQLRQSGIALPSSHDANVIDVTSRIAEKARQEARQAAQTNQSLLNVAAENMLHWQELHLATLGFLACNELRGFAQMVDEELPLIFGLAGSRLIMPKETAIQQAEELGFLVLPQSEIDALSQSETIYLGPPPEQGQGLFSYPNSSMAIMRLPDQLSPPVAGSALVLAGRTEDSFAQGKGRTLLLHLAEMVGVCLLALIEAPYHHDGAVSK